MKYLESRGFDIDYLASQGVGYCSGGQYMQRIIVPFYRNGICRYYQGRTFIDHPISLTSFPNMDIRFVSMTFTRLFRRKVRAALTARV